jgi:signal transduction histidine kinase
MAYSQLEKANERTKESSRMKTSFIRQISHEIRTPLNILSGFVQVITTPDIKLDKDEKEDINQKIIANTNRITELVNKMLELSDASSKTVIDRNDKVKPVQIAVEAMNNFPQEEQNLIPIELKIAENMDDVTLSTNEQAATRALVLLLDNAEKYTKEGYIRLTVEKCTQYNSIHFIVEDTGIGIPIKEREHIFEEFVQLDENKEGTGIGLTVARSICNRLGGSLILDTLYTKGARFIMSLPYRPLK